MADLTLRSIMDIIGQLERVAYDTCAMPAELIARLPRNDTATGLNALMHAAMPRINGMRVIQNELCRGPAKVHKKKRWMSASYHTRIQKKWTKRFGTFPMAVMFNAGDMGRQTFRAAPLWEFQPIRKGSSIINLGNHT